MKCQFVCQSFTQNCHSSQIRAILHSTASWWLTVQNKVEHHFSFTPAVWSDAARHYSLNRKKWNIHFLIKLESLKLKLGLIICLSRVFSDETNLKILLSYCKKFEQILYWYWGSWCSTRPSTCSPNKLIFIHYKY